MKKKKTPKKAVLKNKMKLESIKLKPKSTPTEEIDFSFPKIQGIYWDSFPCMVTS